MQKNNFLFCFFLILPLTFLRGQAFTDSNLPIVSINTFNQYIFSDPKIKAEMNIYFHPNGARNYLTDVPHFKGFIGIEERGSSSSTMGKPCYGFETWDSLNNQIDTNFLSFPKESDWVLYASHNDKTFLRNALTYDLSNRMGNYASRTQHCEVMLNGNYIGLFVMMEKIKRDNQRVNVSKLTAADTSGLNVTGGYIIKSDKLTGSGGGGFLSNVQDITTGGSSFLQFEYPSDLNILPQQAQYIQQYVDSFQQALYGNSFTHPLLGYRNYLHTASFADYLILCELAKNPDAYALSTYFAKPKNDKGRKLRMGPVWDYDLGWKNSWYLGADTLGGYIYNQNVGRLSWWTRMMQDSTFQNEVKCRWLLFRQEELSVTRIHQYIDSMAVYLNEAQQRNFALYGVLGQNVYYNSFPYPATFQEEIDSLKSWVSRRALWLDNHLPGNCSNVDVHTIAKNISALTIFPNPSQGTFTVRFSSAVSEIVTIEIIDVSGRIVEQKNGQTVLPGENEFSLFCSACKSRGMYTLRVKSKSLLLNSKLLIE